MRRHESNSNGGKHFELTKDGCKGIVTTIAGEYSTRAPSKKRGGGERERTRLFCSNTTKYGVTHHIYFGTEFRQGAHIGEVLAISKFRRMHTSREKYSRYKCA
jgi:hypothetical protein